MEVCGWMGLWVNGCMGLWLDGCVGLWIDCWLCWMFGGQEGLQVSKWVGLGCMDQWDWEQIGHVDGWITRCVFEWTDG